MNYPLILISILIFRSRALRALAARRSLLAGPAIFSVGFLAFVSVRRSVYWELQEPNLIPTNFLASLFHLNLVQAILFLVFAYLPTIVCLGNAIAGFGFSASNEEYRAHFSGLLPLWGLLLLVAAPLQWLLPQFLIIGIFGVSLGLCGLLLLLFIYTVWAIRELGYQSIAAAIAVFALSWATLPVFYVLTQFLFALPIFLMFPLMYLAFQRLRIYFAETGRDRNLQQNLKTLMTNPRDADAHYQLGLIHLRKGQLESAQSDFQNAIGVDPEDAAYHYYLGRVFEARGDWAKALEQFEATYRLDPHYGTGDIFREVGKGYLQTGNPGKAVEFLRHFLDSRGSDPEGRYFLAVALRQSDDLQGMRVQLNTILEQARSNPRFFVREKREWIYRARALLRAVGS